MNLRPILLENIMLFYFHFLFCFIEDFLRARHADYEDNYWEYCRQSDLFWHVIFTEFEKNDEESKK